MQLRHHALEVLCLCNPQEKAQAAMAMLAQAHHYAIAPQAVLHCHAPLPGHPARPVCQTTLSDRPGGGPRRPRS